MADSTDDLLPRASVTLSDEQSHPRAVAERIEEIPAPEGADVLQSLTSGHAANVVEHLDPVTASQIVSEMDPALAATVIADMEEVEASLVLGEMSPDDRVDILGLLPQPLHDRLISEMTPADAAEVRHLEQYAPDTAGGIMTTEVTALAEHLTVQEAIDELRRLSQELEQMFYVYVVDKRRHLVGVLSMRDLILARPDDPLARIMRSEVASVRTSEDQESVANLMSRYGYLAMPVLDDRGRLVGLITHDDIVEVLEEEATEDVQKLFGAGAEERLTSTWHFSFRKRVFWLLVNLGTAFLAASVVGAFSLTITKLAILAAYMPIVAGMGGNASAQAMAVTIRGLAMGRVDRKLLRHVILREGMVGLATGIVVGLVTACIAIITDAGGLGMRSQLMFATVVGTALIINHTLACVSGAGIPFIMKKLGFDPAQSATIFATTVTDVVGFFTLLGLAQIFLL